MQPAIMELQGTDDSLTNNKQLEEKQNRWHIEIHTLSSKYASRQQNLILHVQ